MPRALPASHRLPGWRPETDSLDLGYYSSFKPFEANCKSKQERDGSSEPAM